MEVLLEDINPSSYFIAKSSRPMLCLTTLYISIGALSQCGLDSSKNLQVIGNRKGAAVAEWSSSWLAEQEDRGSIPGLGT